MLYLRAANIGRTMTFRARILSVAALLLSISSFSSNAQTSSSPAKPALVPAKKKQKTHIRSIYVSWGYNHEWYTKSNLYVKQGELGNDYELQQISAHDKKGWDKSIFQQAITIPQYNYRIGVYLNEKQDIGIELNFDHTKYVVTDDQNMHIKGTLGGNHVDSTIYFSEKQGFYYFLNNGANFFLFNFVKRYGLYHTKDNYFRLDFLGKAGIGPVVPHVQNSFFGVANDPHFQIGGWNTGLETAVRATFLRYGFLEFSQKVDYARYSHLRLANNGLAHQAFATYELILTGGFILPTVKHNAFFAAEKPLDAPESGLTK